MLHNATSDPLQGWVKNNDRGTANIITSCFGIIILCLWSMLHLNLPAPSDTPWTVIFQRARWMFLGLLYPELVMCFAYAQMMSAHTSAVDMASLDIDPQHWSVVHGFFADMGGFVLKAPDFEPFPITARQLYVLVAGGTLPLPELYKREITDKSKGNWFVKGVAVWQTAYILVTIAIRLGRNMAVTPLEIMTATIGFCAFVTMLLWWRKPLDVETPVVIYSELKIAEIVKLIGPGSSAMETWSDTPLDWAEPDVYLSRKWGRGLTRWIISMGLQERPMKRIPNDRDFKPASLLHNQILALPVALSGALNIYSGYAFTFPTPSEQQAWIILSITSIASLLVYGVSEVIGFNISGYKLYSMEILWAYKKRKGWCWIFHGLAVVTLCTRLGLLGLSLATLRSLPKSCFVELGYFQLFNFVS